jgi:hypothetical protein
MPGSNEHTTAYIGLIDRAAALLGDLDAAADNSIDNVGCIVCHVDPRDECDEDCTRRQLAIAVAHSVHQVFAVKRERHAAAGPGGGTDNVGR